VVEAPVVQDAVETRGRAGLRIGRAVHETRDACVHESAAAHQARFDGGVDAGALQAVVARLARGGAQRQDLGVRGGIVKRDRRVVGPRDDHPVEDHHRADRHLAGIGGPAGLHERKVHVARVFLSVGHGGRCRAPEGVWPPELRVEMVRPRGIDPLAFGFVVLSGGQHATQVTTNIDGRTTRANASQRGTCLDVVTVWTGPINSESSSVESRPRWDRDCNPKRPAPDAPSQRSTFRPLQETGSVSKQSKPHTIRDATGHKMAIRPDRRMFTQTAAPEYVNYVGPTLAISEGEIVWYAPTGKVPGRPQVLESGETWKILVPPGVADLQTLADVRRYEATVGPLYEIVGGDTEVTDWQWAMDLHRAVSRHEATDRVELTEDGGHPPPEPARRRSGEGARRRWDVEQNAVTTPNSCPAARGRARIGAGAALAPEVVHARRTAIVSRRGRAAWFGDA